MNITEALKYTKQAGIVFSTAAAISTLFIGVHTYWKEKDLRKHMLHVNAWSLIAQNKDGNAGLRWAIELLARDGVEMRSLEFFKVDLSSINLKDGQLPYLNIGWSNLFNANLSGTDLSNSHFHCTTVTNTDFSGADLKGVSFNKSNVTRADFRNSKNFTKKQLQGTCVNFDEASYLPQTDFQISSDMFLACQKPKNGIRMCLE